MIARGWYVGLAICVILAIIFGLRSWLRAVRLALSLPGPPALPLFGNVFVIKDNQAILKLARTSYHKYGQIFRSWITILPVITVLDPKHLQRILGSTKFTDKNFLYSLMHTFIGDGLITSSGLKWKAHRKYIQPYFHLSNLEKFIRTFGEAAQVMVNELRNEKDVKISTYVNSCVLDILHDAVLGIPIKEHEVKKHSPFSSGHITLTQRILRPWLLINFIYKLTFTSRKEYEQKSTLHNFAKEILEKRKNEKRDGKTLRWCFLEMLMEIADLNPDFTEQDIVDEACTLMLAGQDSVGAAVVFTLYYLAKYQNVQEKVAKELSDLFTEGTQINMDVLNEMKYLEQCIKETMRLRPSVPIIARKLSQDLKLDEYTLPTGCNVFITPYATHVLPHYYPDPEKFDPERFSAENQAKRHPFAYIPFSAGPRNCIGYKFAMLEMKVVISAILLNYKIALVPGYDTEVVYRITLRAKGGVLLRLQPR